MACFAFRDPRVPLAPRRPAPRPCVRVVASATVKPSADATKPKPDARDDGHAHGDHHNKQSHGCTITFQMKGGRSRAIKAPKGANVLAAGEAAGLGLPALCKQGSCSSCVAKVVEGTVRYSAEPACLTPKLKEKGYAALCCASVSGDAVIETHQGPAFRAERAEEWDRMKHKHG